MPHREECSVALIFPSRWQDGAESLRIEHTNCFCWYQKYSNIKQPLNFKHKIELKLIVKFITMAAVDLQ